VALKCLCTCDNLCFEAEEEFLRDDMAYRRDILRNRKEESVNIIGKRRGRETGSKK